MRERMEEEKADVLKAVEALGHQLEVEKEERLGKFVKFYHYTVYSLYSVFLSISSKRVKKWHGVVQN